MKPTKLTNIAGIPFYIDEDAYEKLNSYLGDINKYFAHLEEKQEIIDDIENRIAENLNELITDSKKIIELEDITKIIETMGTTSDFEIEKNVDEEKKEESTITSDESKKLFRNTDDQIIAGVCSGIAAYLNIDPFIVRLVFFGFALTGGASLIIYIVLWIYMPEAKTLTEKMQMKGNAVTLSNIEKTVKKNLKELSSGNSKRSKIGSVIYKTFNAIFEIIRRFKPLIFGFFGFITSAIGTFLLLILSITAFSTLLLTDSRYVDPVFSYLPRSFLGYSTVVFSYLAVAIPLFFIILIGASLIKGKFILNQLFSFSLLGVWFISAVLGSTLVVKFYPELKEAYEKNMETRDVEVANFNKITAKNGIELDILYGEEYSLSIKGDTRSLDNMEFDVKNNELTLKRKDLFRICLFCNGQVEVTLTTPELKELTLENASSADVRNFDKIDSLDLTLKNASELDINGFVHNLNADIENASSLDALDLVIQIANIEVENASDVDLNVIQYLNAEVKNASSLRYLGTPDIDDDKDGSSTIERMND
jgi:phage shock protein PspC (stress-responsive transcriptional regulator)